MTKILDALAMADALMADDPATFKAGYTRPNAELAVIERFKLDDDERASFLRIMAAKHGAA